MIDTFWVIFSLSFLLALTGAMAPGRCLLILLSNLSAQDNGDIMGLWIISGHALLEMAIILCLLLGFSVILKT